VAKATLKPHELPVEHSLTMTATIGCRTHIAIGTREPRRLQRYTVLVAEQIQLAHIIVDLDLLFRCPSRVTRDDQVGDLARPDQSERRTAHGRTSVEPAHRCLADVRVDPVPAVSWAEGTVDAQGVHARPPTLLACVLPGGRGVDRDDVIFPESRFVTQFTEV